MKKINSKLFRFRNVYANIFISIALIFVCLIAITNSTAIIVNTKNLSAIYSGNTANNNVSLMFNVYQNSDCVNKILDILQDKNVSATFFIGGVWLAKNLDIGKEILAKNNELGNHGYYHKDHTKISETRNREEIDITHKLVKNNLNYDMSLFAPPSGAYDEKTLEIASSLDYTTIMWSKDTIDWRDKNTKLIYSRATKDLKNGDLILMHPTTNTVEALPQIIDTISAQGFNIVKVSECIK